MFLSSVWDQANERRALLEANSSRIAMAWVCRTSREQGPGGFHSQVSAAAAVAHLGPGCYETSLQKRVKPSAAGFGCGEKIDRGGPGNVGVTKGHVVITPGPGAYSNNNQVSRESPSKSKASASSVFQSKSQRMGSDVKKSVKAPSIPTVAQSCGYEQGAYGKLVRHQPATVGHTGRGDDTSGPGEYDPLRGLKSVNKSRATDFSMGKVTRIFEQEIKAKAALPGPGEYKDEREASASKDAMRASSVFKSSITRDKAMLESSKNKVPGPGAYDNTAKMFSSEAKPDHLQFFGSTVTRFETSQRTTKRFDSLSTTSEREPETMESQLERDTKSDTDSHKHRADKAKHVIKPTSVFASSSTRFQPVSKTANPSPGDYEVLFLSMRCPPALLLLCGEGVFKSTSERLKSKPNGGVDVPGPGHYSAKPLSQKPVHMARPDVFYGVGPGQYNTETVESDWNRPTQSDTRTLAIKLFGAIAHCPVLVAPMKPKSTARTVDPIAGCSDSTTVYEDENGVVWNFMLNYTNISYGSYGNNKFYMVQVIQDGKAFKVFRKWGRVGAVNPQVHHVYSLLEAIIGWHGHVADGVCMNACVYGATQRALESYGTSLEKAKSSFQKKFLDKSGNEWPLAGPFEKVAGKYVLVELDDQEPEDDEDANASTKEAEKDTVPSTLPEQVQDVLKVGNNYVLKKWVQLSDALSEIDELQKTDNPAANNKTPGARTGTRRSARPKRVTTANASKIRKLKNNLKSLTSEFYTLIPHDFGRSLPPVIDTMAEVKLKIDLLEVFADLEISQKLQQEKKKSQADGMAINSLDAQYNMINVKMEPLPESEEEYKIIESSILKIARPSEELFHDTFQSVNNHKLLWHGSRLSNVVGILSKGLRIAPPEAPSNGYMFGKGIYFADSVSKSANYCWTTPEQPKGVLILAEVALGTCYEALEAEDLSYQKLKSSRNCDSTHGLGRMAAPEECHETMYALGYHSQKGKASLGLICALCAFRDDGVVVPIGEFMPTEANGELLYNEYIVYRQEQVKLRYIVALDFEYDADPEEETNETFKSVDNHKLLWHGSRLSNVVGILSQGLRIAPPEAPKNGYLFGKGARDDMASTNVAISTLSAQQA
ncbi:Poly polymerase catalytic domain containing protein, partial [Globisporangium splendens]